MRNLFSIFLSILIIKLMKYRPTAPYTHIYAHHTRAHIQFVRQCICMTVSKNIDSPIELSKLISRCKQISLNTRYTDLQWCFNFYLLLPCSCFDLIERLYHKPPPIFRHNCTHQSVIICIINNLLIF